MSDPITVSHIFFDVDGTLVDFQSSLRAGLEAAAEVMSARLGRPVTPQVLQDTRNRVYRAHSGRRLDAVRQDSIRQVFRERGVDDEPAVLEATRRFFEARDETVTPFDDVVPALTALRARGFTLIAATNGNAAIVRTPVLTLLHDTWSADEAGVSKPHPRFFEAALARACVSPAHALMVGDRLDNDVEPALLAGMHALLLDRDGGAPRAADGSIEVIRSLSELPERVRPARTPTGA
ncbi:MAG: HAD family hydrolase [Dehalococcoidia bacterium]